MAGRGLEERDLLARWLALFSRGPRTPARGVLIGPGDDAAALVPSPGKVMVATTDAVVDGAHFDRRVFPPRAVGRKALAVHVSDLAAVGARPAPKAGGKGER